MESATPQSQLPQIAVDPNLATEQAQADQTNITALKNQAAGDTASIMARYGARLALSGGAPSVAGAAPATSQAARPAPAGGLLNTLIAQAPALFAGRT